MRTAEQQRIYSINDTGYQKQCRTNITSMHSRTYIQIFSQNSSKHFFYDNNVKERLYN